MYVYYSHNDTLTVWVFDNETNTLKLYSKNVSHSEEKNEVAIDDDDDGIKLLSAFRKQSVEHMILHQYQGGSINMYGKLEKCDGNHTASDTCRSSDMNRVTVRLY